MSEAPERPRSRATALSLGALALAYALTAARFALGGDGGELAALAARGGVAHPPGYPLYVLYLRAFAWVPLVPAHRASLATALLGVLAVWLLFRAAVSFGATRPAAALAAAIYAGAPLAWKTATYPEVFAGNACLALAIAWLSGPMPPVRGPRRAALLALLAGLGLAHHHTIVLVAPLGLYGFARAVLESPRRGVALALAPLALVLGLTPYVYDVLAARGTLGPNVIVWGDPSTFSGLAHHVLRADYGTGRLGAQGHEREPLVQLGYLATRLSRDFLALPLLLVFGLGVARRRLFAEPRSRSALLAAIVLAGPVFVTLFNIRPSGLGLEILERFHLLPAALSLVFVAPAFDGLFARVSARAGALVVAFVFTVQAALAVPQVLEHHGPQVQRYAENVLAIVPPHAIVVGSGDHRASSFLYAEARDLRPDVTFVQPWLLLSTSYRARTAARLGIGLPAPVAGVLDARRLLEVLVATDRPVFVTDWPAPGMERAFPTYPIGPVLRVVAEPRDVPAPPVVLRENEQALSVMQIDGEPPRRGSWAGALQADYARPWLGLAAAFEAAGDGATAAACTARGRALMPRDE